MKTKATFLILHYKTIKDTVNCIASIFALDCGEMEIEILVVDNGSEDGTAESLIKAYAHEPRVKILPLEENRGFSAGNNYGYTFVDKDATRFLIVTNNDVLFKQRDFLAVVQRIYTETSFDIFGPDIQERDPYISGLVRHRSPMDLGCWTMENIAIERQRCLKVLNSGSADFGDRMKVSCKAWLEKTFGASALYHRYHKKTVNRQETARGVSARQSMVCLHGACIVFSGNYMARFKHLFYPETFLYCEENILQLRAIKHNFVYIYDPSAWVWHLGMASTRLGAATNTAVEQFRARHILQSLEICEAVLKNQVPDF